MVIQSLLLSILILDEKKRRTSMLRCLLLPLESRRPNPGFPVRVAAHLQHGIHLPSSEGTTMFPFWEREGVVVMVIQSLLLRSSPLLLGKGRGGYHGQTEHSSETLSSSSGKGKQRHAELGTQRLQAEAALHSSRCVHRDGCCPGALPEPEPEPLPQLLQ